MKFLNSGICALALVATGATAAPALAEAARPQVPLPPIARHAGELEVAVHKSQVVTADRPIARAMIGSAEVADVLPLSDRSIYVLGKQFGTTSLTLYDRQNRVIAVMDVAVGPDVDGLRRQLGELLPGQGIDARLMNGSVLLTGMVHDAGAAARAAELAKGFAGDKVINMLTVGGSQQIMLEVRFAEVTRQAGEQLGLRGIGVARDGRFGVVLGSGSAVTPGGGSLLNNGAAAPGLVLGGVADTFGALTKSFTIGSVSIDATLDALEKRGLSKTLAEPTLVALSGERASFLAGGEFPIPVAQTGTSTAGTSAISVEFKSFGVSLGFTPTVLADNVISLVVEPEVSSLDPSASVSVGGLVIPGLRTRRASTTIELRDGESFAIAGLLSRDFQTTVRQFPLLGSIPIIGTLFRSSGFSKGETELLIVVTPHLVAPLRPGQVRLPTDRIADPKATDVLIDGEGYHPRALPPQAGAPAPAAPPAPASAPAQPKEQGYEF
ncbi:type II and III secretion system protein family protein [Novosphingobium bradum]|uniref:Type II and III secretion system protein family protein n=1 Tax=Novosphingobium bradum TaxID=1737444 RepID=A0ABV7IPX5_9SPHN